MARGKRCAVPTHHLAHLKGNCMKNHFVVPYKAFFWDLMGPYLHMVRRVRGKLSLFKVVET